MAAAVVEFLAYLRIVSEILGYSLGSQTAVGVMTSHTLLLAKIKYDIHRHFSPFEGDYLRKSIATQMMISELQL